MSLTLGWDEIALRFALTVLAGALLGLNRTERGVAAGLRTTLLVSLAACAAMIEANLLLATAGKGSDFFALIDPMRLPLGVLTGMGFIGAGAILRRGDRIQGVTTAATLWLVTVLGLCFGAGFYGIGLVTLGLAVVILWALKRAEALVQQERRGRIYLNIADPGPSDDAIRAELEAAGFHAGVWDVTYHREQQRLTIRGELHWVARGECRHTPEPIQRLARRDGVQTLRWKA